MFVNLQKLTGFLAVTRTARTDLKILFEFYVFNQLFNKLDQGEVIMKRFAKLQTTK